MTAGGLERAPVELVEQGRADLARGAWEEARQAFEAALVDEETPEALEGVGVASRWLLDPERAVAAQERAFACYRARDDRPGAARCAIELCVVSHALIGDAAVAAGWLERAARVLDGAEPSAERGWLVVLQSHVAFSIEHDLMRALPLTDRVIKIGRSLGNVDLEMLGVAQQGTVLVSTGEVSEGMRRLDQATAAALSGELTHPDAIVMSCCYLLTACARVRDYDRASQWCRRVEEISTRWGDRFTFATCRTQYAELLILRGSWAEADSELAENLGRLAAINQEQVSDGLARLAELRRRQGRIAEAIALFEQAEGHPYAILGRGALALDEGDAHVAAELAQRFMRRRPPEDRLERVAGLEILVRARTLLGNPAGAREAADELRVTASQIGTEPLLAASALAEGLVDGALGDLELARSHFEDAIDLLGRGEAPFERAQARVALAMTLRDLGRPESAATEARAALDGFTALGAEREARRTRSFLRGLGTLATDELEASGLTRREIEVLRLVAAGRSNGEIAEQLVLSVRTVERHLENIYGKIGAEGRSARASAAAYAIRHGLE